jgi:hypothetical protein
MDPRVRAFLQRSRNPRNLVILTTSGDGQWAPEQMGYHLDAISSASKKERVDDIANTILSKVQKLLGPTQK